MSFVYGVVLVVVGSVSANLGNNLVSLGHKTTHEETISKSAKEKYAISSQASADNSLVCLKPEEAVTVYSWTFIGRVIFVLGNLFNFAGFAFGSQSTLSSLESAEFVSNVVFLSYVHAEPITARMILATASIVAGNILVVIYGAQDAKKFTSDDMIHLYKTNTAYHAYLLLMLILWGVTSYAYNTYHCSRMKKRVLMWRHSFMEPLCYSISSSIVGTQAVLNSKCLALLIDATSTGAKNEFTFWYLYMILGMWLILVSYWLVRLDQGLALFPPAFIIPLMQVWFMIFAIICGGIYFKEFIAFTNLQYIIFNVGVALIIFGVYGLAPLDMKLYVPGDPDAPVVVLLGETAHSSTVHPELVLPGDHTALASIDELDKMFDGALHQKPQPCQEDQADRVDQESNEGNVTDVHIYSSVQDVEDASDSNLTGSMFDFSRSVHKPPNADQVNFPLVQQLPPVNTRGANSMGLPLHESGAESTTVVPTTKRVFVRFVGSVPLNGPKIEDLPLSERTPIAHAPRGRHVTHKPFYSPRADGVEVPNIDVSSEVEELC